MIPEDTDETALTLNGKKSNIQRRDFMALAENAGISAKAAEHMMSGVLKNTERAKEMCEASRLNEKYKERLAALIDERSRRLER